MENAIELKSGFHIQTRDSKVTPLGDGVFIPFSFTGGAVMYALRDFLKEYCCDGGEEPPKFYLNPHLAPSDLKSSQHNQERQE